MDFIRVVDSFTEMSNTRKRLELTEILVSLFTEAGEDLKKLVYLIQGKLAPDYEGIELGMADKLLIKGLSLISGKPEKDVEELFIKEGDLGLVARLIAGGKSQNTLISQKLTVQYVYDSLMKLAKIKGEGSIKNKIGLFQDLVINSSPSEAMYITRIVSGKLRLGVSDATILDALVKAFADKDQAVSIEEAYNFHPDIGLIAEMLRNGEVSQVVKIGPAPMIPAKVMLAERLHEVRQILDKMGGTASFEYKYDGLRTQIHLKDGNVRIFSRGSEETTKNFPDIVKHTLETFSCTSCILDGEAVPYDSETGELYPFQTVSRRRGRKYDLDAKSKEIPVVVFLFDIIYLDGKELHREPYEARRKVLESLFTPNDHFKLANRLVSSDEDAIEKFFEQSISSGCEGIVAKNVSEDSVYRAGARGWLWIKLKRDYQSKFEDSLDLVVIGSFGGHGRRKGTYGALLMAAYNKESDTFESICKLGTGFTDEVLFNLPRKFEAIASRDKPARVESFMIPDTWFEPVHVLEIIGAEITISPVHACAYGVIEKGAGLAIRFPRFTGKWRDDKTPEDATTTSEIIQMYKMQKKGNVGSSEP
ncbi:MAG: ATP-dependent DNA ligase [Candidatus Thermoplasmatota archaeon]|nr:ATP-dependent DNA ligase [Candidatus Thermoplasmatota archaeon]MDA8142990.1 ATP-dependent DNA ligase [Thermoplasmatales archaeon]